VFVRGISSGELSYVKVFNVVDQMQFARFNNQGTYFVSANLTKNASSTWGDFIYLAVQSLIVCNGVSYVGPWSITNQGSVGGGSNSFISAACPYGVFPNAAQAGFYHGVGNSGQ
jgi:hypothetical protein